MLATITHHLAQYTPWFESIIIKSAIVLLAALIAGQLLKRSSAALRHFVYATSVVGLLLLPLAAALMPGLRLAVLPASSTNHASSAAKDETILAVSSQALSQSPEHNRDAQKFRASQPKPARSSRMSAAAQSASPRFALPPT